MTTTRTSTLRTAARRKRVWIPAVATVAVLGVGGAGLAVAANADGTQPVTGDERDRVSQAAVDAVGGGEVLEAETSDDRGEAYEVDVLDATGVEWSISLDEDLAVLTRDREDRDDDRLDDGPTDDGIDRDDTSGAPDADDAPVVGAERERVEAAAVEEVGGGEATSVERSDDAGEAFEVEVVAQDGTEWDLALAEDLTVVQKQQDPR